MDSLKEVIDDRARDDRARRRTAYPTLSDRRVCTKRPQAVVPSERSTSTLMPTCSPMMGSTSRTQGSDSLLKALILHKKQCPDEPVDECHLHMMVMIASPHGHKLENSSVKGIARLN